MIDSRQIRMARAALRWTIKDLSERAMVGERTIKRIESCDQLESVNLTTIRKLKACFEVAGIEFIGSPEDRPGIRIGKATGAPLPHMLS